MIQKKTIFGKIRQLENNNRSTIFGQMCKMGALGARQARRALPCQASLWRGAIAGPAASPGCPAGLNSPIGQAGLSSWASQPRSLGATDVRRDRRFEISPLKVGMGLKRVDGRLALVPRA